MTGVRGDGHRSQAGAVLDGLLILERVSGLKRQPSGFVVAPLCLVGRPDTEAAGKGILGRIAQSGNLLDYMIFKANSRSKVILPMIHW